MTLPEERVIYTVVGWVENYLRRVRQSPGAVLDKALAEEMGARGKNWTQLVSAMRALGVVDDQGSLTDLGHELASPDPSRRQAAANSILETHYPTLLGRAQKGEALGTQTLDSYFADLSRSRRGKALSIGGRRAAAALFRFWMEQTGEDASIRAVQTPREGGKKDVASRPRTESRAGKQRETPPGGKRRPNVESLTPETFKEILASDLFRLSVATRSGGPLTDAEWAHMKAQIDTEIEFRKKTAAGKGNTKDSE